MSRGSTSIPRVGLGAATANPEGLWAWPHHGRGLSHWVQIKSGSQTYLASLGKAKTSPWDSVSHLQMGHPDLFLCSPLPIPSQSRGGSLFRPSLLGGV